MGLILVRGGLHYDVNVECVVPIVLALGRPRGSERQPWQCHQPSEVGDAVNGPQPMQRAPGKVRHWEPFGTNDKNSSEEEDPNNPDPDATFLFPVMLVPTLNTFV